MLTTNKAFLNSLLTGVYLVFALSSPQLIDASTITVNTTVDELNTDGDCSLREAIRAANTDLMVDNCISGSGADEIVFGAVVVPGTFALSISGTDEDATSTGDLDITDDLTITGNGASDTIIDGSGIDRVFEFFGPITVDLTGITIQGGSRAPGAGISNNDGTVTISNSIVRNNETELHAGGIQNSGTLNIYYSSIINNTSHDGGGGIDNNGTATIIGSTIAGNSAGNAGGLFSCGPATIINSTIANNTSFEKAGGIQTCGDPAVTITNSTISGNTAVTGGGIHYEGGTLRMQNTIFADNSALNGPDCSGDIISLGNNLIGDATGCGIVLLNTDITGIAGLGGFVDGEMPGHGHFPLLPDSKAIDAGENSVCPDTDQLRNPRPADGDSNGTAICDIGAYESVAESVTDKLNPAIILLIILGNDYDQESENSN